MYSQIALFSSFAFDSKAVIDLVVMNRNHSLTNQMELIKSTKSRVIALSLIVLALSHNAMATQERLADEIQNDEFEYLIPETETHEERHRKRALVLSIFTGINTKLRLPIDIAHTVDCYGHGYLQKRGVTPQMTIDKVLEFRSDPENGPFCQRAINKEIRRRLRSRNIEFDASNLFELVTRTYPTSFGPEVTLKTSNGHSTKFHIVRRIRGVYCRPGHHLDKPLEPNWIYRTIPFLIGNEYLEAFLTTDNDGFPYRFSLSWSCSDINFVSIEYDL